MIMQYMQFWIARETVRSVAIASFFAVALIAACVHVWIVERAIRRKGKGKK